MRCGIAPAVAREHSIGWLTMMETEARILRAEEGLLEHRSRVAAMALCMCGEKKMNEAVEEFLKEQIGD